MALMKSATCPNCSQPIESGAVYCGNCGQQLQATIASLLGAPAMHGSMAGLPAYAVANPGEQSGETKAMVGLVVGVLGVPAALIPLLGMILAIAGLVLGTTSRTTVRRTVSNLAIGFSSLAVVLSIGVYVYTLDQTRNHQGNVSGVSSQSVGGVNRAVETPCYMANLENLSVFDNVQGSCSLKTYNAESLAAATNLYTVDVASQASITADNFASVSKDLIAQTFKTNLPTFTITSENLATFAGSPAYVVNGHDKGDGAIQMIIILHQVAHGENIFILVHGINSSTADATALANSWEWK